jgi:hypothetical protein
MPRFITLLVLFAVLASAQSSPVEELFYYDGDGALLYFCAADPKNDRATFSTTAAESTQPKSTVATATTTGAHGYGVGHRIQVRGATVDTDLNGDYTIATVPSGTTFTFATANVANATYTEAGLKFTSTAPRTNSNHWEIQRFFNTTAVLQRHIWPHADGSRSRACDSRTTYFQ